jgi:hypothetical protein
VPDNLRTIAGVMPGDHLMMRVGDTSTPTLTTITIPASTQAGVTGYNISARCGAAGIQTGNPLTTQLNSLCSGPSDVLVVAETANGDTESFVHTGGMLANGATIDASADTYTPIASLAYDYVGVPAGTYQLVLERMSPQGADWGRLATGTVPFVMKPPAMPGGTDLTKLHLDVAHELYAWGPAPHTLADATGMIPNLALVGFDRASHTIRITTPAGTPQLDAVVAGFQIGAPINKRWSILAPFAPDGVMFPRMPADLAGFELADGDKITGDLTASAYPGGWDRVRTDLVVSGFGLDLAALLVREGLPGTGVIVQQHLTF